MSYDKLFLIFKREYLTRIRTKSFIISTILAPVAIILLIAIPIILQVSDSEKTQVIGIKDEVGTVLPRLIELNSERYVPTPPVTMDSLRSLVLSGNLDGFIEITEEHLATNKDVELLYTGSGGMGLISEIRSDIRMVLQNERLDRAEVGAVVQEILAMRPQLLTRKLTAEGEETQDTLALFMIGYIMCFIIYGAMFGYGAIIMRSVIEEKTNRIIEVITSSVKPFELLMGKVLGVGALGLTQFIIWSISASALLAIAAPVTALIIGDDAASVDAGGATTQAASEMPFEIPTIGPELWITFILFFLLGYLIYSALFASVGSAVDSESDSQQLMMPIMVPIILPMLFLGKVAQDPDSTFSVVTSLIPFFAPMLMPVRVAMTDVPAWEYALSVLLMVGTFIGLIWLSSRIYRVGILMYGKKASFKEMAKWVRYN
ncbi:MAG TPA: ABC transporter permease [Bacteroidetes bacterium]|nr:ABC transporter permease [Bacteroidota bacterium]